MRDELVSELRGLDVASDVETRRLYARDRSPFVVEPLAVARVRSADEVAACVAAAARGGVPVTARAGGRSVAGQGLGAGLGVDPTCSTAWCATASRRGSVRGWGSMT